MITLFHWDLPAALDDRGGWLNPEMVHWFTEYARVVFDALADRVPMWATLNEPWVVTDAGFLHGTHAPGHRSIFEAPIASHHLLLAHADTVRLYRTVGRRKIGLVVNLEPKDAASPSVEDAAATNRSDAYMNRQYLDPVFLGRYPEELREIFGEGWRDHPGGEVERIREPIDFLGINYYTRGVMRHDSDALPLRASRVPQPQSIITELGWESHSPSLTRILCWVHDRYGEIPLYVTENGAAFYDPPTAPASGIEDWLRVHYYREHLGAVREAIARGVTLRGYFAWSLLDNYEWGSYAKRFGLVHVDYTTQKRTIKRSGRFYAEVIRTNGTSLESSDVSAPVAEASDTRR